METCSKHCNDLDINSSPPRSCLDASVGVSTSSDEDHSDLRCNESPEETSGDFATLSTLSGLPQNDDSGVETPLGESPKEEDQIVDAICRRTRAHLSLTDMSLDELETFLQESDEEDYFQNVDDEEEYRKFVAAVQGNWKEGSCVDGIDGSRQGEEDDEDEDEEDDYDFEIELEEALESDYEELPKQDILKRKRRRRAAVLGHTLKKRTLTERPLGSARTPLRPLLPSIAGRDGSSDARKLYNEALNSGKEAIGFTPCQRRQLQCLIQEHVQLLVQVFSVTVLDPARQQIAADTHKLLLQLADAREQVLTWKRPFHPKICCCPQNAHSTTSSNLQPLVKLNAFQPHSPNQFITKHLPPKEASCPARSVPDSTADSDTSTSSNLQKGERNCRETSLNTFIPATRKVNSLLDIAALALVKDFVADVKGGQELRQQRLQISDSTDRAQKPLFPASMIQVPPVQNCQRKKTMAGSLVEDTKLNGIIVVPPEIATAISRFTALFDPTLFPYKPPPAALAKRLLFTEAEDELLAMGLMRYNTNWEKIQQLLLPSKTTHQIFVRQKNRSTARAPENSIKAVRRLKTSPLTKEEEACIEEGLKFFRSDWMKVWEHCVPYRDPVTLSRLWRAAVGLQKSYSASEEAKEKHRIGEKLRRQKQALLKEKNDGTIGDMNSGDETCEDTTGAYFHEAFLADYNSQACSPRGLSSDMTTACQASAAVRNSLTPVPNVPLPTGTCLPPSKSDYLHSAQSLGTLDTTFKPSRRGKRYRRSSFQIIKLAPGLPSLNLPRCVRVISQAKYNSQFSAHGNSSLAPGSFRSQKGGCVASASGSACSFSPTPVPNPVYVAGTPSFYGGEKAAPAKMHPLLMQNTFETGPLTSSTSSKQGASHTVIPGLPSTHNIPRFRPFLPVSKGISTVGSMEVLAVQTESSTRSAAELHPFLQDDGDHHTHSEVVAKCVMEQKSSAVEVPHANGANTGISHLGHTHWPFFLSDSVIRPEPRRAVRVQSAHQDRSASASLRNRSQNVANGKRGSKAMSKNITGHDDMLDSSKETEKESDNFVNSGEEENVVMEQEELSGSEEETEEVVQFEYEEITDSDNDEFDCGKNAIHPAKGEEGIEFEEEEIGSDDGDSEV
ncbi:hypothetical protein GOP47_0011226 [Adiantum capillus-veneris]|uniref:Myb-like domain-containing protein n=1 Tax=Adiantum capillus-veneris TaxID=13818 RepID=A0A9D4USE3_ADICA|nr:hypothetical protein GOP47_0011226 [Adiantum capillus-veneris]